MKKGFTIIEILATIIVLSLIMILAYNSTKIASDVAKEKILENKINTTKQMLMMWSKDHIECFKNEVSDKCIIGLNNNCTEIVDTNYLKCTTTYEVLARWNIIKYDEDEKIINPLTKDEMNNEEVIIYYDKQNNRFYGEI